MQSDIINKQADAELKNEQCPWEPWKALAAAFGAGVAVASVMIAAAAWIIAHLMR